MILYIIIYSSSLFSFWHGASSSFDFLETLHVDLQMCCEVGDFLWTVTFSVILSKMFTARNIKLHTIYMTLIHKYQKSFLNFQRNCFDWLLIYLYILDLISNIICELKITKAECECSITCMQSFMSGSILMFLDFCFAFRHLCQLRVWVLQHTEKRKKTLGEMCRFPSGDFTRWDKIQWLYVPPDSLWCWYTLCTYVSLGCV